MPSQERVVRGAETESAETEKAERERLTGERRDVQITNISTKPVVLKPSPAGTASPDESKHMPPEQIWARVKALWPGFEFMWRPGDSEEKISDAEARLGIKLPQRVRELMRACSGAGFPSRFNVSHAAEVCLRSVEDWSLLADLQVEQGMDVEPQNADLVVIGEDPQGVDFGSYILLRSGTGEVFSFMMNEGEAEPRGSIEKWLLEQRPGEDSGNPGQIYTSAIEEEFGVDEEDMGAEAIAKRYRTYLGYAESKTSALSRWDQIEHQFIAAVKRLRDDSLV